MKEMRENRAKRELLRDDGSLGLLLMIWLYRAVMLVIMMAGVCKFGAMPIKLMSQDCLVVLSTYMIILIILQEIYRA